jgi:integrase
MAGLKAKIKKRTVDAVPVPTEGETWLWDTELKGFFLRVYASGRKVYALKCRVGSRQRIHTIGVHGSPWTPDKAREAAEEALRLAKRGKDPNHDKRAARDALTVAELIDRYLKDGPATKPAKRLSTWAIDASNLNRHIRPLLGRHVANDVTKADAARAVREITAGATAKDEKTGPRGRARVTGGEGTARRTRTTAAAMFAWGVEHDLVAANPFAGVKLSSAPTRERFLTKEQAGALLGALANLEAETEISGVFGDALRLLLLTGARKTEILGLRWAEVDMERHALLLPPERTKAGGRTGERRITLSAPALAIVARRRAAAEDARDRANEEGTASAEPDFVFPAARGDGHAIGLRRAFVKACKRAKLTGLRVHDLRHSFASFAVADGASLFLIGKLLGHASARTTERYAHLASDPLLDAVNQIGRRIMPSADHEGTEADDGPARVANLARVRKPLAPR